jgi:hypothetical protein
MARARLDSRDMCERLNDIIGLGAALNAYYVARVCSEDVREVIRAHAVITGGRTDTPCYITAAAVCWVLSGEDLAAPFSGKWEDAITYSEKQRHDEHAVISFGGEDEDDFESTIDHVLVSLNYGSIVLESNWSKHTRLHAVTSQIEANRTGKSVRCIPFKIDTDLQSRLDSIIVYMATEASSSR